MIRLYRIDHVRQNVQGVRYVPNPLIVNERQLRNMLPDSLLEIYGASWDSQQEPLPDAGEAELEFLVGYWAECHQGRWTAIGWTSHCGDSPEALELVVSRPKWYEFWRWSWWLD